MAESESVFASGDSFPLINRFGLKVSQSFQTETDTIREQDKNVNATFDCSPGQ
jgi:hypothetical protein